MDHPKIRVGIIDGHQLAWRVIGSSPLDEPREHAGKFFVWASLLSRYHRAKRVLVAWDVGRSFRRKFFPDYKAKREKDKAERAMRLEAIREMMRLVVPLTEKLGIPQVFRKGFEADDVIYSFAIKTVEADPNVEVLVYSLDADLLQLCRFDRIKVLHPQGKPLGRRYVKAKLGVEPEMIQTLKALSGDTSDNYKGVHGIGPVKAVKLIHEHGDLFSILAALDEGKIEGAIAKKLAAGRDDARLAWKLAALRLIAYDTREGKPDREEAMSFIMKHKIRDALNPEIFEALFEG